MPTAVAIQFEVLYFKSRTDVGLFPFPNRLATWKSLDTSIDGNDLYICAKLQRHLTVYSWRLESGGGSNGSYTQSGNQLLPRASCLRLLQGKARQMSMGKLEANHECGLPTPVPSQGKG